MDHGVIEVVVNRKNNPLMSVGKIVLIIVAVLCVLNGLTLMITSLIAGIVFLVVGAAAGVGAYFVSMECVVDYEYSLVDRELRIAKIMNKEKRKDLETYDLDKMEILAQIQSHELDSYSNRGDVKFYNYSSRDEKRAATTYRLYLEGNKCLVLDIDGAEGRKLLNTIYSFAPRKIFTADGPYRVSIQGS